MSKRVWLNGAVGVRGIAIVEAAKGLLVLLVGFGLLSLAHRDVEQFAADLVRHAHLNHASHYPHIFIEAATKATDSRLWVLALAAFLYAALRSGSKVVNNESYLTRAFGFLLPTIAILAVYEFTTAMHPSTSGSSLEYSPRAMISHIIAFIPKDARG